MSLHSSSIRSVATSLLCGSLLVTGLAPSQADDQQPPVRDQKNLSIRNEVLASLDRGLNWLKDNQNEKGYWSTPDHPALSALVLTAFARHPSSHYAKEQPEFFKKTRNFILENVQADGGIYVPGKGLSNYNTSVSLTALTTLNDDTLTPTIVNARNFIVGMQAAGMADESLDGGIGYGPGGTNRQHPDLSNTLFALEALHASRSLADKELGGNAKELDWQAAIGFIERTQNLTATNKAAWASDDPANKGGFVYFPGHSMAGEVELADGKKALRSYGSMSYAGLLSYIYADLKKSDPRVTAVIEWLSNHYTLTENPGMGQEGLYYYFHTMAKGLSTAGIPTLETEEGKNVDWRIDLAKHLFASQNADGSWVNENGRWMEKDPVLVTTYAVMALEYIYYSL